MSNPDSDFFVFNTQADAENAIRTLGQSGFDMKQLSLVGKGYPGQAKPLGVHTLGDRIKFWGGTGAFWGVICGVVLTPAVFALPEMGSVAIAGPIVATIIAALEGAVVVGGLSALGAALTQPGVPEGQIVQLVTALKVDKCLLDVQGSAEGQGKARSVLARAKPAVAA